MGETRERRRRWPGVRPASSPARTAALPGTGSVIKLGVNNGAKPAVSPAAAGAPGGGGQTPFISGAGEGGWPRGRG